MRISDLLGQEQNVQQALEKVHSGKSLYYGSTYY